MPARRILRQIALPGIVATALAIGAPVRAADPPPSKSTPPADTKAATVRLDLELIRTDTVDPTAVLPAPVANAATPPAPSTPTGPTTVTVATPKLLTLDGNTASISVTGGDFGYTVSLSPSIGPGGKLLILWNIRLSGKSLPGATGVSATGAARIDLGKSAGIAEISLTDPATGHKAAFRLQGVATTASATDAPTVTAAVPAPTVATP